MRSIHWRIIFITLFALSLAGCYGMRRSKGGGQIKYPPERRVNSHDIALPAGYRIDAIAAGLTFPTGVTFDDKGNVYVVESGYSYGEVWTTPRLLRLEPEGTTTEIARGDSNGPWTGVTWYEGNFIVSEGGELQGGRILKFSPDGKRTVLAQDLPSLGDHHTNGPVVGPDGWIYFGQGTATNSGVVGEDDAQFGWLRRYPRFHDVPGQDLVLRGVNFTTKDPLTPHAKDNVMTGAYSPFGTKTQSGEMIRGQVICNGAILRVRPEGSNVEQVAWGFRNPFGVAFSPGGKLYCTDNMYDERGSRPIFGAGDLLWQVQQGQWHGWPDFHGDEPLNQPDRYAGPGRTAPKALLDRYPNKPPKPAAILAVHSSSDGFDFSRNETFGYVGQAFIAQFGDEAPTTGKVLNPVGFRVVRVDVETGVVEPFAVNRGKSNGPASMLNGGGFERPVAVRFTPDGSALYVVDFGVLKQTEQGARPQEKTGVVWRIIPSSRQGY